MRAHLDSATAAVPMPSLSDPAIDPCLYPKLSNSFLPFSWKVSILRSPDRDAMKIALEFIPG